MIRVVFSFDERDKIEENECWIKRGVAPSVVNIFYQDYHT